jgi:aldose 1-epimerase
LRWCWFEFVGAGWRVTKADWGTTADGKPVQIYTLSDQDLKVRITTFGARVVSIEAPDRTGKMADVVLGYDNVRTV